MKIIITGATGMVGEGVLKVALQNPEVSEILVLGRKSIGYTHQKMSEITTSNLYDLDNIKGQLQGYDATLFCLGTTSVGKSDDEFKKISYDLTMALAKVVESPNHRFLYISGAGTDSSEKGRIGWARIKGKTENDLMAMNFKQAINLRPGYLHPIEGTKNTHKYYSYIKWLYPIFRTILPNMVSSLQDLAEVMISVAKNGTEKSILEVKDINKMAKQISFSIKTLIIALLLFLSHNSLLAQNQRIGISIGAGPSISLGKLAEQITGKARTGMAGGGKAALISVEYNIWKPFGIIAQVAYNNNATRLEPIYDRATNKYQISNPSITANRWDAFTFMGGPTLKIINRRIKFDGRILGGYVRVTSPSFTIDGTSIGRTIHIETDRKLGGDLCYGIGATLGYEISEKLHFVVTSDYVQSTVTFTDVSARGTTGSLTLPLPTEPQLATVGLLNITGGMRFNF